MPLIKLLIVFSLCCPFLSAQNVTFKAEVDATKIIEGSYVDLKFILSNSDGSGFSPPNFKGFEISSGPNRSSSMSIINGNVSKTLSYSYSLTPKGLGKHQIGSATIQTSEGKKSTKPIIIEVVKGSKNPQSSNRSVFVETVLSDSSAFVGQQIILEYKLYTKEEVRSVNFVQEPEFDGFYVLPISNNGEVTKREIINGEEYATKVVKKIALFPQQTGTYELNPVSVRLGIADKNSRSRGFFFSTQLKEKRTIAPGKTILISNTPPTDKPSFSGAVGNYNMSVQTAKRSLTTDDAIVVNMLIQGNGDSKTVSAPKWELSDSLEIYDPNILEDESFQNGKQYVHKKYFEYLIVPKYPGRYTITPEFTYFNTDENKYVTLTKTLPRFNVLKGSQNAVSDNINNQINISPFTSKSNLNKLDKKIHGTLIHFVLIGFLILATVGLLFYHNHITKNGFNDPELLRKQKALSIAQQRLSKANTLITANDKSKFYEELSIAVKQFISDKYNIPALHINKSDILLQLNQKALPENIVQDFDSILSDAEKAIYAPSLASDMKKAYDLTIALFTSMDN